LAKQTNVLPNVLDGVALDMDESGNIKSNGSVYRVEVIAALFGVSVRRVQQLTQEGIISTVEVTESGRKVKRYELASTIQKYVKHLSNKANGKNHSEREAELREQKLQADIALKESQGELHQMKTQIAAGKYIDVEEVEMDYARFFLIFKKFALSIPSRMAGRIGGYCDPIEVRAIERDLSQEISSLLNNFVVAGVVDQGEETLGQRKKNSKV